MSAKRALVVAAVSAEAGKTTLTLGLLGALRRTGRTIAAAKSGPDYIDLEYLAAAVGSPAATLDAFAMSDDALRGRAQAHMERQGASLLIIEGDAGLFDGARGDRGDGLSRLRRAVARSGPRDAVAASRPRARARAAAARSFLGADGG